MGDTHEKIIFAARELFEKQGFAAATTKEIACLAGVSEVTLFRHFENKRKLFEETLHSCIHAYQLGDYLENDATGDLEHDLKLIAYNIMDTYKKNAPMIRMMMRDKIRNSVPEMNYMKNEHVSEQKLREYFVKMKSLGKTEADPEMAVMFYTSNIIGYLMRFILTNRQSDEDYFAWMLDKVIAVLKS